MKTIRNSLIIVVLFFSFAPSQKIFSQAPDAIKFWIRVYGASPAVANMSFGNRIGNTTSGQDTGLSFPVEYREQEAPPPSPGFDAVWGSVRGATQFGSGVRGLLDRQFNGWSGVPTQKDTFRINFAQADDADQDISFKWIDAVNIALRCDSLVMVYLDPNVGSNIRLNMSSVDTFVIHAAGTNGVGFVKILKYGGYFPDDVKKDYPGIPYQFSLHQNYPNPFNPETKIQYSVASSQHITIKIFDVVGREMVTLVDETVPPGDYTVVWHANNVPSGVYFYRIQSAQFTDVKKMSLMR